MVIGGIVVILAGAGLGYGLAAFNYLAELQAAQREKLELQRQMNASVRHALLANPPVRAQPQLVATVLAPVVPESPLPEAEPVSSKPANSSAELQPQPSAVAPIEASAETPIDGASWQQLIHEAAERAQSDVLCIVDVDYLRQYRECYGAELGDYVSNHVLRVIKDSLADSLPGAGALISRYEGQEFILGWPAEPGNASQRLWAARKITAKLRADIERAFLQVGSECLTITASLGLALCEPGLTGEQIIGRADEALVAAKKAGRNRGYFHIGNQCLPIEPLETPLEPAANEADVKAKRRRAGNSGRERRRHERKPCDNINLIAPCSDGVLPAMDQFQRVQFFDISSSGFSMIVPTVPAANQFAVALINSRGMIFMAAEVANVRQAQRASAAAKPLLVIGCRFLQRLHPEAPKARPAEAGSLAGATGPSPSPAVALV